LSRIGSQLFAPLEKPLILGLDIGSSSIRAALYDGNAVPVPRTSAKIERVIELTSEGGAFLDADEEFTRVAAVVDRVLERSTKLKAETEYVASCAFWHSLVGVDANGKPTTKVLTWADTRSRDYSGRLKKKFNERVVHDRTGAHFHSSYLPAKLSWLRTEFPDVWQRTTQWLSLSDYIALKLFGTPTTSVSMASGTGLFEIRKCEWDSELLKFLKIQPASLPVIASDGETFRLNRKYAKRWPHLANAKWFQAIADGAADNIGAGCTTKSRAALMVGTSAAMRVAYTGEPPKQIPDGLWCYRIDRKRVIVGGALNDGGNLYQYIKDKFRLGTNTDELIRLRDTSNDDLIVLPFFFGERSTGYNEDARGAIIGLKPTDDGVDILRAAMEGVAFRLAEIYERLKKVASISEIVASGGALSASPVWTQIIADFLGRDLVMNTIAESSSRGAVLLVLESIGKINEIEISSTAKEITVTASKRKFDLYQNARKRRSDFHQQLLG